MGTVADKLTYLGATKDLFKADLRARGVTVLDSDTFRSYVAKYNSITKWHPDPAWPDISNTPEGAIAFIVQDRTDAGLAGRMCFIVSTSLGNYHVDWGDGTSADFADGATADHTYIVGGGTSDGKGHTTYKCVVTAVNLLRSLTLQYKDAAGRVENTCLYCKHNAPSVNTLYNAFFLNNYIRSIVFPSEMSLVTTMSQTFYSCTRLENIVLPTSMNAVTSFNSTFYYCVRMLEIILPTNAAAATTLQYAFTGCEALAKVVLPISLPLINSLAFCFSECINLQTVTTPADLGSGVTSVNADNAFYKININAAIELPYAKLTKIRAAGNSSLYTSVMGLTFHTSSSFSGTSPQIDVSYSTMSRQALVNLFNLLPTLSGKTINITGAIGAASLTADDRAIATAKGWTITG